MQTVPSDPSASCTTYERIQRMSEDISSSPTCFERAAAAWSSSGVPQPLGRRITYSFMETVLSVSGITHDCAAYRMAEQYADAADRGRRGLRGDGVGSPLDLG